MTLVIYLSVLCLFVCFYLRSLKNVQCYLHFRNEELVFGVKTYSFVLPSCNGRVVWGLNYPFFAVQSHQRAMEYVNVATS